MDTPIHFRERFLDFLPACGGAHCYQVGEHQWSGFAGERADSLSRQCAKTGAWHFVRPSFCPNGTFTWEWSLELSPTVHVCKHGVAPDLLSACEAASACRATFITYRYLDTAVNWYEETPERHIASIDDDRACVRQRDAVYAWTREWAKGGPALRLAGGELRGVAGTFEEALVAAVNAPELFKRGCAALVAQLCGAPCD
jgi:hypothetical protein